MWGHIDGSPALLAPAEVCFCFILSFLSTRCARSADAQYSS